MERCIVAESGSSSKEEALIQVTDKLNSQGVSPKLIIFFSNQADLWFYSMSLYEQFPDAQSIGTSSYNLFSSEGYDKTGLTAMAVYDGIECTSGLIFEVNRHPMNYYVHIRNSLEDLSSLENTCCLEFTTSFSHGEEIVQDTFRKVLEDKNIPVFGGSSGGNMQGSEHAAVALNGTVYLNTCAFVFIHNLNGKICLYKENIYKPTDYVFYPTDVDCEDCIVYEYDNVEAKTAIEKALGVTYEKNPVAFKEHPMGRITGDDISIIDVAEVNPDKSIRYFSRIYNQTKMVLLEKDDIPNVWRNTAFNILNEVKNPSFTVCINCHGRSKIFEDNKIMDDFIVNLKNNYGKFIGVSTIGEQLNFENLNQTCVLAVFE